jgi:hypothetical protein
VKRASKIDKTKKSIFKNPLFLCLAFAPVVPLGLYFIQINNSSIDHSQPDSDAKNIDGSD